MRKSPGKHKYTDEQLKECVPLSTGIYHLRELLGSSGARCGILRKKIKEMGLDNSHWLDRSNRKYTDEQLIELVPIAQSARSLKRLLNSPTSGSQCLLKHIKRLGLSIDHWNRLGGGQVGQCRKGQGRPNDPYDLSKSSYRRQRFIKYYRDGKEVCDECGCSNIWQGKVMALQMHHVDGDNQNWVPENIQLLCPNCHATTDNYGGRSRRIDIRKAG